MVDALPAEERLWCQPGGHWWSRDTVRGPKPATCGRHSTEKLSAVERAVKRVKEGTLPWEALEGIELQDLLDALRDRQLLFDGVHRCGEWEGDRPCSVCTQPGTGAVQLLHISGARHETIWSLPCCYECFLAMLAPEGDSTPESRRAERLAISTRARIGHGGKERAWEREGLPITAEAGTLERRLQLAAFKVETAPGPGAGERLTRQGKNFGKAGRRPPGPAKPDYYRKGER